MGKISKIYQKMGHDTGSDGAAKTPNCHESPEALNETEIALEKRDELEAKERSLEAAAKEIEAREESLKAKEARNRRYEAYERSLGSTGEMSLAGFVELIDGGFPPGVALAIMREVNARGIDPNDAGREIADLLQRATTLEEAVAQLSEEERRLKIRKNRLQKYISHCENQKQHLLLQNAKLDRQRQSLLIQGTSLEEELKKAENRRAKINSDVAFSLGLIKTLEGGVGMDPLLVETVILRLRDSMMLLRAGNLKGSISILHGALRDIYKGPIELLLPNMVRREQYDSAVEEIYLLKQEIEKLKRKRPVYVADVTPPTELGNEIAEHPIGQRAGARIIRVKYSTWQE